MTLAILIPVLGREHQIDSVLQSIERATKIEHRVIFVCSKSDPVRKACLRSSAEVITVPWEPDRADFAQKINRAYELTDDEWYFQAATDLKFHPSWAERALQVAGLHKAGVIGTNDLGNPSVKKGNHSTHILFSRSYIEEYGGTYDDSGTVFSTAYDHQFVDTEFVQTALLRRQFRASLRSCVEHMHPHWGKGEMDDTYRKSERSFLEDARVYNARMRKIRTSFGVDVGNKPYRNRRMVR